MKKLYFKVKLLSDVILNQKAATEGPNATLDFIPGANFMGVVAGKFYADIEERKNSGKCSEDEYEERMGIALDIFHSGKVRFGDAHLGVEANEEKGTPNIRTCKVPASMYYPKLSKPSEELYISHLIPEDEETQGDMRNKQLKQCRNGFFYIAGNEYVEVKPEMAFAIKSAHDRKMRTSKESQMYGYQSLCKGAVLFFEVDTDERYEKMIKLYLEAGSVRIGRSRSAQYGQVEICCLDEEYVHVKSNKGEGRVTVYADSRLVFIDEETGNTTFRPTPEQLGLTGGKINWAKSQVRTFQYSPWNFKRQCFDTDRCGFEKGSVFVVDDVTDCPDESIYIGEYKNEGFGRVIYNPDFLKGELDTGKAEHQFKNVNTDKENDEDDYEYAPIYDDDSPLMKYLKQARFDEDDELFVYQNVNDWVYENAYKFSKHEFASQWGTIRTIATLFKTRNGIIRELFDKKVFKEGRDKPDPMAYLTHGVAKDKWNRERLKSFEDFCKITLAELDDKYFRFAIINLAAEMAKRCRKENKK